MPTDPGAIVVAGHVCLDLIPELPRGADSLGELLVPGALIDVGPMVSATGGAVANVGVALHKLGLPVRLVGKTGDDSLGDVVRSALRSRGGELAEHMIVAKGESSSYSVVINPPGIDRVFLHHPGPNDTFSATDIADAHLAGASLLHFGYPPIMARIRANDGAELVAILRRARNAGLTTSLDMSFPDPNSDAGRTDWPSFFRNVLPHVDVFLPSLDEMAAMLRSVKTEEPARESRASTDALRDYDPASDDAEDPIDHFVALLIAEARRISAIAVAISPMGDGSVMTAIMPGDASRAFPAPPPGWHRKIVARLKDRARLDLLNHRDKQRGDATFEIEGKRVYAEISTRPVEGGEAASIVFGDAAAAAAPAAEGGLLRTMRKCAKWSIESGAAIVGLKLGDQGLYLRTTQNAARLEAAGVIPREKVRQWIGRELVAPCFDTNVAGTTGAGDCTIAGFLASLHSGAGPMETVTFATAVGACGVETPDATGGILPRGQVMKRVLDGWPKRPLTEELPGWHWLDAHKVWIGPDDLHL